MTPSSTESSAATQPLSLEELRKMNAYWRAANYLSVGQIYLYANPLLRGRRWRERDRAPGGELAFQQISQSCTRWSGPSHFASERVQDRKSDGVGATQR